MLHGFLGDYAEYVQCAVECRETVLLEECLRKSGHLALQQRLPGGLILEAVQPHASINAAMMWHYAKLPERHGIARFAKATHPPRDS